MADLIDRAALKIDTWERLSDAVCDLVAAPTIDAKPVVHGEWVSSRFNATYGEYEEQCSCCKGWSLEYDKPYCPNCGAKMDGGKET